jgi:hypothetical protein
VAAGILVGLFLGAAVVVATGALPALALGQRRARMLAGGPATATAADAGGRDRDDGEPRTTDGGDDAEPTLAL